MKEHFKYSETSTCSKVEEIPTTEHYALIEDDCYYSDGGYPESGADRYDMLRYRIFKDNKILLEEIEKRTLKPGYSPKAFRVFKITPVPIQIKTTINLGV